MEYFKKYVSNTLAGSGNQYFFINENETKTQTGRVFYKIFSSGKYRYSFLFSNTIDSTYSDGSVSNKNRICDEWYIESARIAVCDDCNCEQIVQLNDFVSLTFEQNADKVVHPGEIFSSDMVELDVQKGQFLCMEISFQGRMIPYHEESLMPTFLYSGRQWVASKKMPVPSMIGCDRKVEKRIAFLGDSITQGIGTEPNTYTHWNAYLAQMLGEQNAYWNLGLGFGRADDAASDGAWLYKAKHNDIVFVCFGVNDILQGFSEQQIKDNLKSIVEKLKQCNIKTVLQTIPPFDYDDAQKQIWHNVNKYIHNDLSKQCDLLYDCVDVFCDERKGRHFAKYGPHPDGIGCEAWAKSLYAFIKDKV